MANLINLSFKSWSCCRLRTPNPLGPPPNYLGLRTRVSISMSLSFGMSMGCWRLPHTGSALFAPCAGAAENSSVRRPSLHEHHWRSCFWLVPLRLWFGEAFSRVSGWQTFSLQNGSPRACQRKEACIRGFESATGRSRARSVTEIAPES